MRVDLFDFDLPEERIALRPTTPRDAARLLAVTPGEGLADRFVRDLPGLLRPGDALVLNDTRVIPARLTGERIRADSTAHVEVTLTRRTAPSRWEALARPAKRLAIGDRIRFGAPASEAGDNACLLTGIDATVIDRGEAGEVFLRFDLSGPALDDALANVGVAPLPPYIATRRAPDGADRIDYQTIYAREDGAVAAPTAGLHFTDALFDALAAAGVSRHMVTLHVGAGTFLPVKTEETQDHFMHAETGTVSPETADALNAARAAGGRIVAVGTTSLRLLESAADDDGTIRPFSGKTSIFITPGYRFKAVDLMMTNFHLPRSTLFMLVSAFSGRETMLAAYKHAIGAGYRFYSYGDACLLHPEKGR